MTRLHAVEHPQSKSVVIIIEDDERGPIGVILPAASGIRIASKYFSARSITEQGIRFDGGYPPLLEIPIP